MTSKEATKFDNVQEETAPHFMRQYYTVSNSITTSYLRQLEKHLEFISDYYDELSDAVNLDVRIK